jgi:single-strand DNA-binding protein
MTATKIDKEKRWSRPLIIIAYWQSPNVAKSLTKGTLVELSGRTSSNAWIGKDGEIRSGLNFHTSNIKFHGGGKREDVQNFVTEKAQDKKHLRKIQTTIYHSN